jgi:hypothetical protein
MNFTILHLFRILHPDNVRVFSQNDLNFEGTIKTETTSLPYEIFNFGVYQDYFYIAAFMAILLGGVFYKLKARNAVLKHPFTIYQDADRRANLSIKEGEISQALDIYQNALHQIKPLQQAQDEDSSSKQVEWIISKKIEELKFEMEEKH